MARPDSLHFSNQTATLKQLKMLIVVLVLSNVGLGAFSFYLLRQLDRNYSEIFDQSVPILNDLQTLTAQTVGAMRGTNPAYLPKSEDLVSVLEKGRAGFTNDRNLREKLLKSQWVADSENERKEFATAGEAFDRLGAEVIAELAAGRMDRATQLRDSALRPAFERYLAVTTKLSDVVEASSRRLNDAQSERTENFSRVVLGIAGWPVLLLVGLLLLTAIFVLVLMLLFRGREMSDMP